VRAIIFAAAVVVSVGAGSADYVDQWGLPVGQPAPPVEAPDQTGVVRDLASLSGENGLLLFFNRSTDW
jgi:hypothetical protein